MVRSAALVLSLVLVCNVMMAQEKEAKTVAEAHGLSTEVLNKPGPRLLSQIMEAQDAREAPAAGPDLRWAIQKLGTASWREAQGELLTAGKSAIPFLIEGLNSSASSAYNLGGHVKADSGRAARQRPVAEICAELLAQIVSTKTTYKGTLPGVDAQAWQTWYATNGSGL